MKSASRDVPLNLLIFQNQKMCKKSNLQQAKEIPMQTLKEPLNIFGDVNE